MCTCNYVFINVLAIIFISYWFMQVKYTNPLCCSLNNPINLFFLFTIGYNLYLPKGIFADLASKSMYIFPFLVSLYLPALILSYTWLSCELVVCSADKSLSTSVGVCAPLCARRCLSLQRGYLLRRSLATLRTHARAHPHVCVGAAQRLPPLCLSVSASHSAFVAASKALPKIGL